jgi:hypothetical protein
MARFIKKQMEIMAERQTPAVSRGHGVRSWLRPYPWEDVIRTIAGFWRLPPEHFETRSAREVQELWERQIEKDLTMADALRLCRRCQTAKPFGKYDCESFVIIARDIVKPFLGQMSATLAAAVIIIVGDYVRGSGDEIEMQQTLNLILEKFYNSAGPFGSPGSR